MPNLWARIATVPFRLAGEGTFTPLDGATPFIGTVGTLEKVREYRLEVLLDRARLPQALKSLIAAHPYEEPAYDIYPLHNRGRESGLGRIGSLPDATTLAEYAARVAAQLGVTGDTFCRRPCCSGKKSGSLQRQRGLGDAKRSPGRRTCPGDG